MFQALLHQITSTLAKPGGVLAVAGLQQMTDTIVGMVGPQKITNTRTVNANGKFCVTPYFFEFYVPNKKTINCMFFSLNTNTHNTLPSAVAAGYKPHLLEKMWSPKCSNAISDSPVAARQRTRPVPDAYKTPQEKASRKNNLGGIFIFS
jgi:hypothetical protein